MVLPRQFVHQKVKKQSMVSSHDELSILILPETVVSGATCRFGKLFPGSSIRLGTNLCPFSSSRGKGIKCTISNSTEKDGGVAEISESEPTRRFYTWPDYKVGCSLMMVYI